MRIAVGRYDRSTQPPAIDEALRTFFAGVAPEIVTAYLYGSRGRGTATATSDVDVAALYADDPASSLEGLPLDFSSATALPRPRSR